jgi:DNA (cytosine-5)-methyltransferase 1
VVASHSPEYLAAPGWRTDKAAHRQDADGSIRISPRQAGILQSFPPDYPWRGSLDERFTQIGNAIPPLLAKAVIAEAISVQLKPRTP